MCMFRRERVHLNSASARAANEIWYGRCACDTCRNAKFPTIWIADRVKIGCPSGPLRRVVEAIVILPPASSSFITWLHLIRDHVHDARLRCPAENGQAREKVPERWCWDDRAYIDIPAWRKQGVERTLLHICVKRWHPACLCQFPRGPLAL